MRVYRRLTFCLLLAATLGAGGALCWQQGWLAATWHPIWLRLSGPSTVADVMASVGADAMERLAPDLQAAGFGEDLPRRLRLVAFKDERVLQTWGSNGDGWSLITTYTIRAASGGPGPKLAEGDRQVPEGLYPITHLNPNSAFHLSLGIGYPNDADRAQANVDGRHDLGGDIMVHGKAVSVGCLALGDRAIEEVFALVAEVGPAHTDILIVPWDLTRRPADEERAWVLARYAQLATELHRMSSP